MEEIGPIELGSFPIAVYGVMFAGTVGGQFAGVAIDTALHRRAWLVPIACSVVFEAFVGARFALSRVPRELTVADWGRLSAFYSGALALFSVPLALWTAASRSPEAPLGGMDPARLAGVGLALLVVATLARWGFLTLLGRRRA